MSSAPKPVKTTHVALPFAGVGPLSIDRQFATMPVAEAGGQNYDAVASVDLATGRTKLVAKTMWPTDGLINFATRAGDWVVYVDQSRRQGDSSPDVLWRVIARNVTSGDQRVLASNGESPDPFVPIVKGGGGYAFWTQAEPDRSAKELVWRPGEAAPRTVLRHMEMTPGSESVAGDKLVYLGPSGKPGRHGHTIGGDCRSIDLSAPGQPAVLTHTALAMSCAMSESGQVAWAEHIDPHASDLPPDGVLDDPYLLVTTTPDGHRRVLQRGYFASSYLQASQDYVGWTQIDGARVVTGLADGSSQQVLPGGPPGGFAVGDGMVGYLTTRHGGFQLTVRPLT